MSTATARKPRLPAFGRELLALRRRGLVPERNLCVGHVVIVLDRWQWGRSYSSRLVVAPDLEPRELDFSAVAGLDVTIFWSAQYSRPDRFLELQDTVVRAGARVVQVFECFAPWNHSYVLRPGAEREAA